METTAPRDWKLQCKERHRYSQAFGDMPLADYMEMCERTRPLCRDGRLPEETGSIYLYEGAVLDGWQRCLMASELGVEPYVIEAYEGDDPQGFVLSKNVDRHHLSKENLVIAALEVTGGVRAPGRPKADPAPEEKLDQHDPVSPPAPKPPPSVAEVSARLKVSPSTVKRAAAKQRNPKAKGKKATPKPKREPEGPTLVGGRPRR